MPALAHFAVTEEHHAQEPGFEEELPARSMKPGQLVSNWKLMVMPLTTPRAKLRANTLV